MSERGGYCNAVPPEGSGQPSTARCVIWTSGAKHTHRIMATGYKWNDEEQADE